LVVVDDAGWPVATLTLAADTVYYFSGEASARTLAPDERVTGERSPTSRPAR
jgi:hypothetical protein